MCIRDRFSYRSELSPSILRQPYNGFTARYKPAVLHKAFFSSFQLMDQQFAQFTHPVLIKFIMNQVMKLIFIRTNTEILFFPCLGIPDVFLQPGDDPMAGCRDVYKRQPLDSVRILELEVMISGQSRSFQFPFTLRIIRVTKAGLIRGIIIRA